MSEEVRENKWKLKEGVPCTDWFPENPILPIYSEKGIKLTDAIPNYSSQLIVSEKHKAIFEEHSGANFEYLPVRVSDKKGRVTPNQYYIANLLDIVDCVDMKKSSYEISSIIKDQVLRFSELIFNEGNIDASKQIFRLKNKTDFLIIDHTLARVSVCEKTEGNVDALNALPDFSRRAGLACYLSELDTKSLWEFLKKWLFTIKKRSPISLLISERLVLSGF